MFRALRPRPVACEGTGVASTKEIDKSKTGALQNDEDDANKASSFSTPAFYLMLALVGVLAGNALAQPATASAQPALLQSFHYIYARRYRGMMTKDAPMFAQKEAAAEAAIKAREHRIMTQGTEQEKKALEYAKRESKRNN
eukprot:7961-Heterococcus_DN1.PRE.3